MPEHWIPVTSDRIEFVNTKFGGAHSGAAMYAPQDVAGVGASARVPYPARESHSRVF